MSESVRLRNVSGHPYHLGDASVRLEAGACLDLSEDACPSLVRDCRLAFDAGALVISDEDDAPEITEEVDPLHANEVQADEVDEDPTEEVEQP